MWREIQRGEKVKSQIIVGSEELTKTGLAKILQSIRDCEQANFKNKEIMIFVDAPELSSEEVLAIITGITPGFPKIKTLSKEAARGG